MIYLDTHVVAWLYAGRVDLLTDTARRSIRDQPPLISPMVRLELDYLFEIGRTCEPAEGVVAELAKAIGLSVCSQPFEAVVEAASEQRWTRDPFDRLVVAQAQLADRPLLTKDQTILDHFDRAIWH